MNWYSSLLVNKTHAIAAISNFIVQYVYMCLFCEAEVRSHIFCLFFEEQIYPEITKSRVKLESLFIVQIMNQR